MPSAKNFRYGPRLRNATARSERGISVEDFPKRAESVGTDKLTQRFEETQGCVAVVVNAKMREGKRPEEPTPDGTLMIGSVPLARPTAVVALVSGLARSEAAQTVGGKQALGADVDDGFLLHW
jgi:hypothetical protein